MPRRVMVPVLAICAVLSAVRPSAAQSNTVLNVTALPASCTTNAVPNDPNNEDDWPAFYCAVGLLPATGGEIYVPAGKYYLSQAVTVTDHNVTFRGEGRRVSTLIWNGGDSNGLAFQSTSTAENYTLGVRSLSLLKGGSSDGLAAIRGQWVPVTLPPTPSGGEELGHRKHGVVTTTIHDVQIGPMDWDTSEGRMWALGIELVNSTAAYISQFDISGRSNGNGIAAIQIGGGAANTKDSKSIATKIRDGRITRYVRGIETRDKAEGIHVEYVTMQEVTWGIQMIDGTGTALTNNRILASGKGVELTNVSHITVSHNRIEQFGVANFIGIHILAGLSPWPCPGQSSGQCAGHSIGPRLMANSIMSADAEAERIGIKLEGNIPPNGAPASYVWDAVIQQNNTLNMNKGIWLKDSSVVRAGVVGNINRPLTVNAVVDNGTLTYFPSNH
jgi:hypothetical protein